MSVTVMKLRREMAFITSGRREVATTMRRTTMRTSYSGLDTRPVTEREKSYGTAALRSIGGSAGAAASAATAPSGGTEPSSTMPSAGGTSPSPPSPAGGLGFAASSATEMERMRLTGASITLRSLELASARARTTSSMAQKRHCQPNIRDSDGGVPASAADSGNPSVAGSAYNDSVDARSA